MERDRRIGAGIATAAIVAGLGLPSGFAIADTGSNSGEIAVLAASSQQDVSGSGVQKQVVGSDVSVSSAGVDAGLDSGSGSVSGVSADKTPYMTSAKKSPTKAPSTDEVVYTISDNYPAFATQIQDAVDKGATTIRLTYGSVTDGGKAVFPASITKIQGWQNGGWFDQEGPKTREIGYISDLAVSFETGSNTTVDHIDFYSRGRSGDAGATIMVPEGATVRFSNCSFSNTPTVNGVAVFENCKFSTGQINNNGICTYTGSTVEPTNVGTPKQAYEALAISSTNASFGQVVKGSAASQKLAVELKGTKAADAKTTASVLDKDGKDASDLGLSATYDSATKALVLFGTPTKAGSYTVRLTASCQKDDESTDTTSKDFMIEVQESITAELRGSLQAFTSVTGKKEASAKKAASQPFMILASASAGGAGTSTTDNNKLELYVAEGKAEPVSILEFERAHPGAKVSFQITPEGSGMSTSLIYDTVYVDGDPDQPGTYQVSATVTDGARTATTKGVSLRIYSTDKTLAQRFDELPAGTADWDMEPYEIASLASDGKATVPTTLRNIYGSHESGVYGQIGDYHLDYASQTLTVPAGADVTLTNMKVNSSVRIVVEKGGKLTLNDSVAYGPIDVYGTLSGKAATKTDRVTLHDGAAIENLELNSHDRYLTDGNYETSNDASPVVVDGAVSVHGANKIAGDEGAASLPGQDAIVMNAGSRLVLADGSSLEAVGGDVAALYPSAGGAGIRMNEGARIEGKGSVKARGGQSYQRQAGAGIAGSGIVDVEELSATGGETAPEGYPTTSSKIGTGGDGVESGVKVRATKAVVTGGAGANPGSSEYSSYEGKKPSGEKDEDKKDDDKKGEDIKPSGGKDGGASSGKQENGNASKMKAKSDGKGTGTTEIKTVKNTRVATTTGALPKTMDPAMGIADVASAGGILTALGTLLRRRKR